ncbi:MAG TPA: 30S ribosomal protein S9 [Candidatus Paceibacterota bacterium]|nr:30S ribosomal protein S9 [Candidatus Paceibacterota bacterium]
MAEGTYIQAVGRRKTSVARVRMEEASKASFIVNEKPLEEFFPTAILQKTVMSPFTVGNVPGKYKITVKTTGGGVSSQAQAVRHGIARALIKQDPELRKVLKADGLLMRDPRSKERRKFGLKKARKSPQWSKR